MQKYNHSHSNLTTKENIFSSINNEWIEIGKLENLTAKKLKKFSKLIGLYKLVEQNEIIYVGRAIEIKNGGFRKRLRDYTRISESARDYTSGRYIHNSKSVIKVYILVLGNSYEDVDYVKLFEKLMILNLSPKLNYVDNDTKRIVGKN